MSDVSQGPGWWYASDGKWYPPEQAADYVAPPADPVPAFDAPAPTFDAPAPTFDAPAPTFDAPAPTYEPPAPTFEAPPTLAQPPITAPQQSMQPPPQPMQQPGPPPGPHLGGPPPGPPTGPVMVPPVRRGRWNFGAGIVVAEFVVTAAMSGYLWALHESSLSDSTTPQILGFVAAGVSLLAVIMLSATIPWSGMLTALAGLATAIALFWDPLQHWSTFTDSPVEEIVGVSSLAAVPLFGLLALGLRRSHPRV